MTLDDLAAHVRRGHERYLTLKEAAEATEMSHSTIKSWVYRRRCLSIVRVGPFRQPRIRASVLVRMFLPQDDARAR